MTRQAPAARRISSPGPARFAEEARHFLFEIDRIRRNRCCGTRGGRRIGRLRAKARRRDDGAQVGVDRSVTLLNAAPGAGLGDATGGAATAQPGVRRQLPVPDWLAGAALVQVGLRAGGPRRAEAPAQAAGGAGTGFGGTAAAVGAAAGAGATGLGGAGTAGGGAGIGGSAMAGSARGTMVGRAGVSPFAGVSGRMPRTMFDSISRSLLGPPIMMRCSTLSRRTMTRRRPSRSTSKKSVMPRRGGRLRRVRTRNIDSPSHQRAQDRNQQPEGDEAANGDQRPDGPGRPLRAAQPDCQLLKHVSQFAGTPLTIQQGCSTLRQQRVKTLSVG